MKFLHRLSSSIFTLLVLTWNFPSYKNFELSCLFLNILQWWPMLFNSNTLNESCTTTQMHSHIMMIDYGDTSKTVIRNFCYNEDYSVGNMNVLGKHITRQL